MINILGINFNNDLNPDLFRAKVREYLNSNKQHFLVTPNPEIVLKALEDEELFHILNQADLSLPDGFGLKIAALLSGKKLNRLTGADSVLDILDLAEEEGKRVLILLNNKGLSGANDLSLVLKEKYPRLSFLIEEVDLNYQINLEQKVSVDLSFFKKGFLSKLVKKVERKINQGLDFLFPDKVLKYSADVLICNFGAPYQEKFIYHNLPKLSSVKLAIGIGGALDFLTKKVKRAPRALRFLGLEWLWRLIQQPHRYKRIYRAVIVFPSKFIYWRFIAPLFNKKIKN